MDESLFQSGTSTVTHLTFKYRICILKCVVNIEYSTELDCVTCHLIRTVTNDACLAFQIRVYFRLSILTMKGHVTRLIIGNVQFLYLGYRLF